MQKSPAKKDLTLLGVIKKKPFNYDKKMENKKQNSRWEKYPTPEPNEHLKKCSVEGTKALALVAAWQRALAIRS